MRDEPATEGASGRCDLRLEGRLLLGGTLLEQGVVLIRAGRVCWSGPAAEAPHLDARQTLARQGATVVPGFTDLHVHGGGGHDVSDGTADALEQVCRVHAGHGTTALCATVLSSSPGHTLRALEVIRAATGTSLGGVRVLGAHLEGPFLNPRRAGAQPRSHLRDPDPVLLDELVAAAGSSLRVVTLAPELPGALELVERLRALDVVVAMGHSDATYQQAVAGVDAGCRLATHTYNAMRGLHHREPGLLATALLDPRVTTEVIADGHHVSAPALRLLWRLKGPGKVALITDCTAALDAPPGGARLGQQPVTVTGGAVRLADGTLAGSALTMDRAVANMMRLVGLSLPEAVAAASVTPAALLGHSGAGSLEAGSVADLLLLNDRGQCVKVTGGSVA